MNRYDDRYQERNADAQGYENEVDPRQRQYTGQYAGRYTGQLTGQIPRLDPRDYEQGDFNPLDYYKGEGPSPAERRQYQQEQLRRRPPQRRQRPDAPRTGRQRASQSQGLDMQYTLRRVGADFRNLLQRLFGVRPESVFRAELSWVSRALLLVINIFLSGLFALAGLKTGFAVLKQAMGADLPALFGEALAEGTDLKALMSGKQGWSIFGTHLLHSSLNLVLLGAGLFLIFRLLQREPRSLELAINTLSISSLMHSVAMILILLCSLLYKPLYFSLAPWALLPLYFNIALGFNELNRENRRSGYWLLSLLILSSVLLLSLLQQLMSF